MTKLQEYRVNLGISQFELAKRSNVSIQTIQKYEQNVNCIDNCHLSYLVNIADVLNISFVDLLDSDDLRRKVVKQFGAQLVQNAEL